jgi:hypothetical protein
METIRMISKVDKAKISVQYVGFQAKPRAREYTFHVRQESGTREFTLMILNEAFTSSRISFQDAPGFCSEKLHRELATFSNNPPHTEYKISEVELTQYRDAHAPRSFGRFRPRKPAAEI